MIDTQLGSYSPPPFFVDTFRFTGFVPKKMKTPLFPTPNPENLVVTYFSGDQRTADFLATRSHKASVLRDFINRAATFTLLSGHKIYAMQLILHGDWRKEVELTLASATAKILRKKRMAIIHPFISDISSHEPNISAMIWAEKNAGAPVFECNKGDQVVAAIDLPLSSDSNRLRPFPDWDARILKIWTEKYPTRQKTVSFGTYIRDFSSKNITSVFKRYSPGKVLQLEPDSLTDIDGFHGIILVCRPSSTRSVIRRLRYLNRRADIKMIGEIV